MIWWQHSFKKTLTNFFLLTFIRGIEVIIILCGNHFEHFHKFLVKVPSLSKPGNIAIILFYDRVIDSCFFCYRFRREVFIFPYVGVFVMIFLFHN